MTDNHSRIVSQVHVLHELCETEPLLRVRGLLEQLELSYKEQLADVSAAELAKVQGALKQVMYLRQAIFEDPSVVPRL